MRLLTFKDAAAALGITVQALYLKEQNEKYTSDEMFVNVPFEDIQKFPYPNFVALIPALFYAKTRGEESLRLINPDTDLYKALKNKHHRKRETAPPHRAV